MIMKKEGKLLERMEKRMGRKGKKEIERKSIRMEESRIMRKKEKDLGKNGRDQE